MNEGGFKTKLRGLLKKHIYIQSMTSYATNGTPDLWISAKLDLWLEVKFEPLLKSKVKPKLSPLQTKWLNDRHNEGRHVAVIVGVTSSRAALFLNGTWNDHSSNIKPLTDVIDDLLFLVTNKHEAVNVQATDIS